MFFVSSLRQFKLASMTIPTSHHVMSLETCMNMQIYCNAFLATCPRLSDVDRPCLSSMLLSTFGRCMFFEQSASTPMYRDPRDLDIFLIIRLAHLWYIDQILVVSVRTHIWTLLIRMFDKCRSLNLYRPSSEADACFGWWLSIYVSTKRKHYRRCRDDDLPDHPWRQFSHHSELVPRSTSSIENALSYIYIYM